LLDSDSRSGGGRVSPFQYDPARNRVERYRSSPSQSLEPPERKSPWLVVQTLDSVLIGATAIVLVAAWSFFTPPGRRVLEHVGVLTQCSADATLMRISCLQNIRSRSVRLGNPSGAAQPQQALPYTLAARPRRMTTGKDKLRRSTPGARSSMTGFIHRSPPILSSSPALSASAAGSMTLAPE
jgi:hypothetical protein